ncbi:MAG: type II secretion system major pseudopilin GspG [Sedimentisphaerales bacterium]|nr:type II secretion system major pseudopilin GspG [Sedimentisphaerales bacterium]
MNCPKGGNQNPDNAQSCNSCGAVLTSSSISAEPIIPKTSGLAIAALIISICGLLTVGLLAPVGLILSIVALRKIQKSDGKLGGKAIAIVGIIISVVTLIIMLLLFLTIFMTSITLSNKVDQARVLTTRANLRILHSAVNQFKMDTGRYPTEDEGLTALVEQPIDVTSNWEPGGYLDTTEVPKDGWGNDFIYQLYPEDRTPFVIMSFGADGRQGGEGINADLLSTDRY